jgi:biotin synthase-like enzyme
MGTTNNIKQAGRIFQANFPMETRFERAIFLSWYCSRGDCKFCYMSTQKQLIKDPRKARRSFESIFAEAIISRACGWEIEFLSGGYDSFSAEELLFIAKTIYEITGKKQWLNLGTLSEKELKPFQPYAEGFCGTVECINPKVRKDICPSKPLEPILKSFRACEKLGLKKAMTIIIGVGETIDDFPLLEEFIKKNNIDRITFYSLNPQKGTMFTRSPDIGYYEEWIARTRISFPKLQIIAGAWHDKTNYFGRLLFAGANALTKFPAIKYLGTRQAKEVEQEAKNAGRKFLGTLTRKPKTRDVMKILEDADIDAELKEKISAKLHSYGFA